MEFKTYCRLICRPRINRTIRNNLEQPLSYKPMLRVGYILVAMRTCWHSVFNIGRTGAVVGISTSPLAFKGVEHC